MYRKLPNDSVPMGLVEASISRVQTQSSVLCRPCWCGSTAETPTDKGQISILKLASCIFDIGNLMEGYSNPATPPTPIGGGESPSEGGVALWLSKLSL